MGAKVSTHIRSNVVGYVALIIAVMGVPMAWAVARNSIGSPQLKPNAVKNSDLADNSVGSPEVNDNSLTGADVSESTLGPVPSAVAAATANSATSAGNADQLDGLDSTAFLGVNAQAADANLLDGLNSTAFLGAGATAADSNLLDGIDSSALVNGTGRLLDDSISVTSDGPLGTQIVLPLPGLGRFEARFCGPSATPGSRAAGLDFVNTSGSDVEVWDDGGFTAAENSRQTVANGADTTSPVGSSTGGNGQSNEIVQVHVFRTANGASAAITIGEKTDNDDCFFSLQAVVSN